MAVDKEANSLSRVYSYYRGFSRDVTPSRVCLVTPLIRHFGGQAFGLVCAVCIVMRCRYFLLTCSWRDMSVDALKRH